MPYKNKEDGLKRDKKYYQNNKDGINKKRKQYRKDNPEKTKQYRTEYREENYERLNEQRRQYQKHKRETDLKFNLSDRIGKSIRKSLKRNKNGRRWETLVGYGLTKLIIYLKNTIPEGYTWKDYLDGKLHIDHIIPISAFNFTKPEHIDFQRCWALENLQLLPAEENLRKSNKLSRPFQPALAF